LRRADIAARLRADVANFIARDQSPGVLASEQLMLAPTGDREL
jgi:hypothetical protein